MGPAALAAAVVSLAYAMGWHGVDTAAQVYRVDAFRRYGFSLWDFGWYGGHWTVDYSVIYPALAATVGILAVTVVSAAGAAYAFDRLARPYLGPAGVAASYLFALGTLVAASIGQLTFLAGEGFGIPALLAASHRRYGLAAGLSLCTTLTSPLTGAFLALAAAAWALDRFVAGEAGPMLAGLSLSAVAGVPVVAVAALFPGDGPMPYPAIDWLWEMVVAAAVGLLAGRRHRPIAFACGLWALAGTFAETVPSALGGNVGRLEDMVALPLGMALAWERRPLLSPFVAVPLALSQWMPALGAITSAPSQPSTKAAFFAPLDHELLALGADRRAVRVEVVPTEYHWEAADVAPVVPLARGWERQLDEGDNPIFYRPGALNPGSYRRWLLDNGVGFVALASAPLDMAGESEARLLDSTTVPGLSLVWSNADWKLWSVAGTPGIVSGPAVLISERDAKITLQASRPGLVTVRVRYSPDWFVAAGAGCDERDGDWIRVDVDRPGRVELELSVLHPDRSACPAPTTRPAPASPTGAVPSR